MLDISRTRLFWDFHFTADQFKNWILYFSIPVLYGILPHEQLECWQIFVLACRILCKHQLSLDVSVALLLHTFKNMHGHLKEAVEDYGPVFGFWLFSFERHSGILGRFVTGCSLSITS